MNRRDLFRFLPAALTTRLSRGQTREIPSPIRIGLNEVDELMGGLPPGSLAVLYSHHQGGKTTLAINIAEHVAIEERRRSSTSCRAPGDQMRRHYSGRSSAPAHGSTGWVLRKES
jgi:replicative DNA helicase